MNVSVYSVYRFMDKLHSSIKPKIEETTFRHSKKILDGRIGVVFYDMTTLYFEASEEDDFRIPGYSKDGKHQQPQIMIGLLVGRPDVLQWRRVVWYSHPQSYYHPNHVD